MIYINNKDVTGIYVGRIDVSAVYRGLILVWSKLGQIMSCYGNGYWIDEYPWADNDAWMD